MSPEKKLNFLGGLCAAGAGMMAAAIAPGGFHARFHPTMFKAGALIAVCSYLCLTWLAKKYERDHKNNKNSENDETEENED